MALALSEQLAKLDSINCCWFGRYRKQFTWLHSAPAHSLSERVLLYQDNCDYGQFPEEDQAFDD
jgi:hypothetical protein